MDNHDYMFEVLARQKHEELERKLNRMARYNLYPAVKLERGRLVRWAGMVMLAIRNAFIR